MSSLPFRIAYLDINDEMRENYSATPSTYGGGRVVGAAFLSKFDNFHIYGPSECFNEVGYPKTGQCFVLQDYERRAIREGQLIDDVIGPYLSKNYDLILHHFSQIYINTTLPTLCWPVGYAEPIHPNNKHIALFDQNNQSPRFYSNNHVIYQVAIGPKIPPFQEYKKDIPFFNVGRITPTYQSIQIAQLAHKYQVPMVFAGPLDGNGYGDEFLKLVDGNIVQYLGVVDNATKIEYYKRSMATCQFMNYPISVTLSMKEHAGYGGGVMATSVGQYRTWVKDLHTHPDTGNGFFIQSEKDFEVNVKNLVELNQKSCYDSVLQFSEEEMINKFITAFQIILQK